MQTDDALDALLRADYVRRRTREELRGGWFAPTVFGLLLLVSVGPAIVSDRLPSMIFWTLGGAAGVAAVFVYYRSRQHRTGAPGLVVPEVATAVGFWIAAFLLAGVGSYLNSVRLWWLFYPRVGWGLPVLGMVTLAPLGAPLAVIGAYFVAAWVQRSTRTIVTGIAIGLLMFLVGAIALTLADNAALVSVAPEPGGVGFSSLSSLGTTVIYRIVPTVAYALVLLAAGRVMRLLDRSRV